MACPTCNDPLAFGGGIIKQKGGYVEVLSARISPERSQASYISRSTVFGLNEGSILVFISKIGLKNNLKRVSYNMTMDFTSFVIWYISLLILGVVFFPLTRKLIGERFVDLAYPFSKTVGILALSYTIFVLGTLRLVSFSQISLAVLLLGFTTLNILLVAPYKKNLFPRKTLSFIVFEEILFIVSLAVWAFIRGHEPSIRGLEKFMDFGFINSIIRSSHFPPLDMWYSGTTGIPQGFPINYYYFGHLTGAVITKLSGLKSNITYNLLLATIFALSMTQVFSMIINIISHFVSGLYPKLKAKTNSLKLALFGIVGAVLVNLAGNLHTIYLFTTGYPNEKPVPFWNILGSYNPSAYWYPNATRFIPFTIHEFPSYSYVVADLHGHVFDIPFVLLSLTVVLGIFINLPFMLKQTKILLSLVKKQKPYEFLIKTVRHPLFFTSTLLGFLIGVHYMTNAVDGPIYLLLVMLVFILLLPSLLLRIVFIGTILVTFAITIVPFSLFFKPFVSGIGVNCSPDFLTNLKKIGPFLFEKGNCQVSALWMLFILWGFFVINAVILFTLHRLIPIRLQKPQQTASHNIHLYMALLFAFGIFLIIIPEFFYIKDIYPAHFRANTMFKLGYQAFIMMSIASTYTLFRLTLLPKTKKVLTTFLYMFPFFLVVIYPFYSVPSYYGDLSKKSSLNGSNWLKETRLEDYEIIDYLNTNVKDQPTILEAQGDSYTDYERISAYTGLPTVAGWWVHEWLWRGSSSIVSDRIPHITTVYESISLSDTIFYLKLYNIKYVVVSSLEREKYPNLNESKFLLIGKKIFTSSNGKGAVYQLDLN